MHHLPTHRTDLYVNDNFICFVDTGGIRTPLSQCKCDVLAITLPGPYNIKIDDTHMKFPEHPSYSFVTLPLWFSKAVTWFPLSIIVGYDHYKSPLIYLNITKITLCHRGNRTKPISNPYSYTLSRAVYFHLKSNPPVRGSYSHQYTVINRHLSFVLPVGLEPTAR